MRARTLFLVLGLAAAAAAQEPNPFAETRLRAIIKRVEAFRGVEVVVADGVAVLTGRIGSLEAAAELRGLAADTPGVAYVDDRMEVDAGVAPAVGRVAQWGRDVVETLPLLGIGAVIFLIFLGFAWAVGRADAVFRLLVKRALLRDLVRQTVRVAIVLVGLYLALDTMGATALVGAVLGTVGVVGLALGFAFRGIVENYLASILLSLRRPFEARDDVEIDGVRGLVVRLTSTDTVLMTPDGNHVRLANGAVFQGKIVNYTRNPLRRFDFAVGVGTEEELGRVQELALDVLREMPGVVDEPNPVARIETLGDSSVTVRYFGWVDQTAADFGKVRSEAIRLVKTALDAGAVDMPAPIYQVLLERDGRNVDGDTPAPAAPDPEAIDVSKDHDLERQVAADQQRSDEQNLLDA